MQASAKKRGLRVELDGDGDTMLWQSRRNRDREWRTLARLSLNGALKLREALSRK